jgi:Arylsulfatase regulator (Fe-S oxidoreductase)
MSIPVFQEILLKLVARCNLNCTYCYWFRDQSVYAKPPILTSEAEKAFLHRLESHIQTYQLRNVTLILHGGEPLLFGKARFVGLMDALAALAERTHCTIQRTITTNAVLIDEEWAQLFRLFAVHATVSVDGPASVHDRARVDLHGRGSYERVRRGIQILRSQGIEPSVLAVCDPASDPAPTVQHFVEVLGLSAFDILVPDATHDDHPPSIAPYYLALFDLWYDTYLQRGISIRYLETLVVSLVSSLTSPATIHYNPVQTLTVLTDGAIEPVDVLRIAGNKSTQTTLSVFTHNLQDLVDDPLWQGAYKATCELPPLCQACRYSSVCAGGYLPHRWSAERQYANPSVYCADLLRLYDHIWERIVPELQVESRQRTYRVLDLLRLVEEGADHALGRK